MDQQSGFRQWWCNAFYDRCATGYRRPEQASLPGIGPLLVVAVVGRLSLHRAAGAGNTGRMVLDWVIF
jgi:hypothetical protein